VAFAAFAAVVVTPAAIVLLGDRLDSFDVRVFVRRLLRRPDPVVPAIERQFWYRSTKLVMRRAVPFGLLVIAVLLALGAPYLHVKFGFPDDRVLPKSASSHQVGDQLRNDFPDNSSGAVTDRVRPRQRVPLGRQFGAAVFAAFGGSTPTTAWRGAARRPRGRPVATGAGHHRGDHLRPVVPTHR
jgi:hypothetical protein